MTKKVLGFDCPGCGLQRSIAFLLKGEFLEAFYMYPAIYTLIPLLILVVAEKLFKANISSTLILGLGITSVALILINYTIKLIN
ncbi:DUF2752 domain-containing protein [Croceivirga radicis]|nr:DUF2752 domain-containing protein [Croceivirga radicis]